MIKRKTLIFGGLFIAILVALLSPAPQVVQATPLQQTNLLSNGGFEEPYNGGLANTWSPWHRDTGKKNCDEEGYAVRPGWNGELNSTYVLEGSRSQIVGNQFDTWNGGVFTTVDAVPGQTYVFTFQARVRASNDQVPAPSDFGVGIAKAGIDPNGSGLWSDTDIVWGTSASPVDQWLQVSVQATATGDKLTVFTNFDFSGQGNCRAHLDSWSDSASLTTTSPPPPTARPTSAATATRVWPTNTPPPQGPWATNTPRPGSNPPTNTPPPPAATATETPLPPPPTVATNGQPVAAITRGPAPTPDAEGLIRMAVPPGGSMWTVAALAGITLDEIATLNNLPTNAFVQEGQLLVVGVAEPPAEPTFTPVPKNTAEPASGGGADEEPEAKPTATSLPPTATPEPVPENAGMICVNAFGDTDGNGRHEPTEGFMAGVTFNLMQDGGLVESGLARGTEESVCFRNLPAGSYVIEEILPQSLEPTTATELPIDLATDQQMGLEFGSRIRPEPEPTAISQVIPSPEPTSAVVATVAPAEGTGGFGAISGIVVLGIAVLLLGGLIVVVSRQR